MHSRAVVRKCGDALSRAYVRVCSGALAGLRIGRQVVLPVLPQAGKLGGWQANLSNCVKSGLETNRPQNLKKISQ